jgi:hypothetical protein
MSTSEDPYPTRQPREISIYDRFVAAKRALNNHQRDITAVYAAQQHAEQLLLQANDNLRACLDELDRIAASFGFTAPDTVPPDTIPLGDSHHHL